MEQYALHICGTAHMCNMVPYTCVIWSLNKNSEGGGTGRTQQICYICVTSSDTDDLFCTAGLCHEILSEIAAFAMIGGTFRDLSCQRPTAQFLVFYRFLQFAGE
jgi:hypothetical protein